MSVCVIRCLLKIKTAACFVGGGEKMLWESADAVPFQRKSTQLSTGIVEKHGKRRADTELAPLRRIGVSFHS